MAQQIDPDLQLYSGPQYLGEPKSNFGLFLDSSPDRWGRVLMRRREAAIARAEGRKERTLLESDWILSPAYDINPVATGTGLKLNISETDNALDSGLAMQVAG